jgi:hypothetical protein
MLEELAALRIAEVPSVPELEDVEDRELRQQLAVLLSRGVEAEFVLRADVRKEPVAEGVASARANGVFLGAVPRGVWFLAWRSGSCAASLSAHVGTPVRTTWMT